MQKWDVTVNGLNHEIVYEGSKVSGLAKIRLDGNLREYRPVLVKNVGMFYLFDIAESEFILRMALHHNTPQGLIQDGVYLETGQPIEDDVASQIREAQSAPDPLSAKHKAYLGSFLTFVVLTFVNMFLIAVNSSFSFPFSATVPQILFGFGWYAYDLFIPVSQAVLIAAGVLCAAVYLVLYFLARKWTWPILTALILIAIDTAFLIYISIGDFSGNIIDIAFHAWVLWSIIQLYRTRRKLIKTAQP